MTFGDGGLLNPYKQDIEAINVYIMGAPIVSTEAARIRDNVWLPFFEDITFYNQDNFDRARNIRNDFNRANVKTEAEATHVDEVIKNGMSSEEMKGETDRRTTSGDFRDPGPSKVTPVLTIVLGIAAVGAGLWALTEITTLVKVFKGRA